VNQEFWNNRYASDNYVYGIEPNSFLKEQLLKLNKGKILFPAEGEGRNAVFAAKLGFNAVAFDMSEEARKKAMKLARNENVTIKYNHSDFEAIDFPENHFDFIALIYAHFPDEKRQGYHRQLVNFLKPGGKILLEGFSIEQLQYNSGGPQNKAMLFTKNVLLNDFQSLNEIDIESGIINLQEGEHHKGEAAVIRMTGIK